LLANQRLSRVRLRRWSLILAAALAGFGTAALAGFAIAKTFTLEVGKHAKVSNILNPSSATKVENIAVNSHGFAVYTLSGEKRHHIKCKQSNMCLSFWIPVTVKSSKSVSKDSQIKGRLGSFTRNGFRQVTLNGDPLYTFVQDKKKNMAVGEGIHTFGGFWHVVKAKSSSNGSSMTTTTTTTTTSGLPGYP
jgi:predicted lipoprotein with Yx(FWY)xxD motif